MAKNTNNKRIPVKWVRDRAKAAYDKKDHSYICGTSEDLELHHLQSITLLLNEWADRKSYDISTDEGILAVRDEFIAEHHTQIYEWVYTLCNKHHVKLHGIYGKAPTLASAPKQSRWLEIQRTKVLNGESERPSASSLGAFGSFY